MLLTQASRPALAVVSDIVALTKPRLSSLVVATTAVGVAVAPGTIAPTRATLVVLATALLVGAANVLNSYLERGIDARMPRTAARPLAAGRLDPRVALYGGLLGGVVMVPLLALAANLLTAALGAVAYVTYVAFYTPLKQHSSWALPVGAVPGALPPALGVTAVTGALDTVALVLFAILFFWQLPHFISISLYLRDEYAAGGLRVFAVAHGDRAAARATVLAVATLVPVSLAPALVGLAGTGYAVVALVLGVAFLALSVAAAASRPFALGARRVFRGSLVYLVLLLAAVTAAA